MKTYRLDRRAKIEPGLVERTIARAYDALAPAGNINPRIGVRGINPHAGGPVKVLGVEAGVNITVGLPVIRTSVDHGTAFDIAGTGKADGRSLLVAIEQAIELAPKSQPRGKV
jgi:4-hydroxy-L-threonine phosphate dehydrogenase PdxA